MVRGKITFWVKTLNVLWMTSRLRLAKLRPTISKPKELQSNLNKDFFRFLSSKSVQWLNLNHRGSGFNLKLSKFYCRPNLVGKKLKFFESKMVENNFFVQICFSSSGIQIRNFEYFKISDFTNLNQNPQIDSLNKERKSHWNSQNAKSNARRT